MDERCEGLLVVEGLYSVAWLCLFVELSLGILCVSKVDPTLSTSEVSIVSVKGYSSSLRSAFSIDLLRSLRLIYSLLSSRLFFGWTASFSLARFYG